MISADMSHYGMILLELSLHHFHVWMDSRILEVVQNDHLKVTLVLLKIFAACCLMPCQPYTLVVLTFVFHLAAFLIYRLLALVARR